MPTAISRTLYPQDLVSELQFGEIYYVDPSNGNDANDGASRDEAFKTLQQAIDTSTDNNGDRIIVYPGTQTVEETVAFNKKGITVMATQLGYAAEAMGERFAIAAAASYTDGPAATITQPCTIHGLGFAGRETAGENLLVDSASTGGFNGGFSTLHNCRFLAWYGAIDSGVRQQGGQYNQYIDCTWDGIFGGFGDAGITFETDGLIDPGFTRVEGCRFSGLGSGKHAIVHASGSTVLSQLYKSNTLDGGFTGNLGKFLDNTSTDSTGLIADNWVAPLANQAAAFENLTNSTFGFADNHYEEA